MLWFFRLCAAGLIAVGTAVPALARPAAFEQLTAPARPAILSNIHKTQVGDAASFQVAQKGGGRVTPPGISRTATGQARGRSTNRTSQTFAGRVAAKGTAAMTAIRNQGANLLKAGANALKRPNQTTKTTPPATQAHVRQQLAQRMGKTTQISAATQTPASSATMSPATPGVPLGTPTSFDPLRGTLKPRFNDAANLGSLRGTLKTRFNDAANPSGGSSAAQDKPPQVPPPAPPGSFRGIVGPKP